MLQTRLGTAHDPPLGNLRTLHPFSGIPTPETAYLPPTPRPFTTSLIPQNWGEGITGAFDYTSLFLRQGIKFLTCFIEYCLFLVL